MVVFGCPTRHTSISRFGNSRTRPFSPSEYKYHCKVLDSTVLIIGKITTSSYHFHTHTISFKFFVFRLIIVLLTPMILHAETLLSAVGILTIAANAQAHHRRRCAYGDDCWPDAQTWNDFNTTVGGRLIRSFPSAAVCHTEGYNVNQCNIAKQSWLDSFWRTNQTGAYSATVWEMGNNGQCFIDTPVSAPCDQGIGKTGKKASHSSLLMRCAPLVPYYSVRAESVEDIQKTVKFASEKDVFLVIKNTGHDQ